MNHLRNLFFNKEETCMKLIQRIGLDKVVIKGFRIVKANLKKLRGRNNVTLEEQGKATYLLEDGESFKFMKIKDNRMFGTLVAGSKDTRPYKTDYQSVEIVIRDPETANLQNLTVKEFKERVDVIFSYLEEEYGIVIDKTGTRISYMEINCTFYTKEEFQRYHRVLGLMMYNLPNKSKKMIQIDKVNPCEETREVETYYRGNKSMEIKIYDKKRHLKWIKGYEVVGNIMRIELILRTAQKVTEVFGTNLLWDLTDKMINEYYYSQAEKLFEKRFRWWKRKNSKQLENLIMKHKEKNGQNWQQKLLDECCNYEMEKHIPLLLDIEDLLEQVKRIQRNGQYSRTKKSLLNKCVERDVFLQKDNDRMEEILKKIEQAFQIYEESEKLDKDK